MRSIGTTATTPLPTTMTEGDQSSPLTPSSQETPSGALEEVEEQQQLTRTQALMEAVLPECQTLDRLCNPNHSSSTVDDPPAVPHNTSPEDTSPIALHTDLSDPSLRIWVVTTAALPWRTGTSVNPLARALYLTDHRPAGHVTLVVPFVTNPQEQAKIYPKGVFFETPTRQEQWIRTYCAERVHCPEKANRLNIMFYEATYNPGFASIFATVDICALIPKDQAHVCILEEPEHLNWMRVVQDKELPSTSTNALTEEAKQSDTVQESNPTTDTSSPPSDTVTTAADATVNKRIEMNQLGWQAKFDFVVGILHTNYDAYVRQYGMGAAFLAASALHALSAMCTRAYCHKVIRLSDTLPALDSSKEITCNVHGVLSEFLQAPSAVEEEPNDPALASIYFIGKLIWAKGFDKLLEIQELYKSTNGTYFALDIYGSGPDDQAIQRAFFGRKGILEGTPKSPSSGLVQKDAPVTTPDRTAKKIFDASINLRDQLLLSLSTLVVEEQVFLEKPIEVVWDDSVEPVVAPTPSMEQQLVLAAQRKQQQESDDEETMNANSSDKCGEHGADPKNDLIVSIPEQESKETDEPPPSLPTSPTVPLSPIATPTVPLSPVSITTNKPILETMEFPNPFLILSELSSQFVGTGFFATKAVSKIGQNTVGFGLNALSSEQSPSESSSEVGSESEINTEVEDEKVIVSPSSAAAAESTTDPSDAAAASSKRKSRRLRLFDPIKSRYELRRHPIPARFMGMKDHAVLKDVTRHKIFFNPSESEVLCTTSAEALAMGKFVILPKHPSNTFFLQFENCLAYESKIECVEKIKWALEHDPKPLSERERFQLTWEGANERLFEAAAMTEREVEDWKNHRQSSDIDAARLHYETIKRGRGVQKLLHRSSNILSKKSSTVSSNGSHSSTHGR